MTLFINQRINMNDLMCIPYSHVYLLADLYSGDVAHNINQNIKNMFSFLKKTGKPNI